MAVDPSTALYGLILAVAGEGSRRMHVEQGLSFTTSGFQHNRHDLSLSGIKYKNSPIV